jgi:hypothetical protein
MRRLAIGSVAVLAVCACAGTSAFAAPSNSAASAKPVATGPSITPAQATGIAKEWGAIADRNGASWDAKGLARTESPPLLNADRPTYAANKAAGRPVSSPPYVFTDATVYVPHQTSFPAQFLAVITFSNGGAPSVSYVVFVKPSKSAPWRTPYQASFSSGVTQPAIALDKKGYASVVKAAEARKTLTTDPATLGAEYASYLTRSVKAGAAVPSPLFTPDFGAGLIRDANTQNTAPFTFSVAVKPTRDPVYSYRTQGGGALSFFTTSWDIRSTAPDTVGYSVSRSTDLLDYPANTQVRFVNWTQLVMTAISIPPKRDSAPLSPAAEYAGTTSVDWKPA